MSMNESENVLWENEIKANLIQAQILLLAFLIGIITSVCVLAGDFDEPRFLWEPLMAFVEVLFVAGAIVCLRLKGKGKWLKYLLISILVFGCAAMDSMFTVSATLLICAPVILSSRYYSRAFTTYVSLSTLVLFTCSTIWGANHGLIDLNCMELPLGTVIRMDETTWIGEAVQEIPYDQGLMIVNVILYEYLPKIMLFSIFALTSIIVTGHGRRLVQKQQELTTKSAILGAELNMASNIQSGSLPHLFPAFPERKEFTIYATMDPAKEIGGDFYDFYLLDQDHLALVVADVSGKGIPAALFMMISKTVLRSVAKSRISPRDILMKVNETIAESNEEEMFVTVWLGILEISTGKLRYSYGGHEKMVLYQDGSWRLMEEDQTGIAVGMCEPDEIEELPPKYAIVDHEVTLSPGDAIFQYTDGVPESINEAEEQFGLERMLEALNDAPDVQPEKLLVHMRNRVNEFVKDAPQFDDLTMLGFYYYGEAGKTQGEAG